MRDEGEMMSAESGKRFKPYPTYKDSGVEWLGEIPAHWEGVSLKRISWIRYGLGQPPAEAMQGLPLLRATNISSGRILGAGMMYVGPGDVPPSRDAILSPGEIIVVRSGAYTGDSAIVPEEYTGSVVGYDLVVTVHRGFPPFVAWQLLSPVVRDLQFSFYSLRAAQPHLNAEQLGSAIVVSPPIEEQRTIAAFLHRETTKIDALVSKKERLIELLQEKRTALITRAVTKGLDPSVPMKDSGVEWLGQIPAHWETMPLKLAAKILGGGTPAKANLDYWSGDIPWVSPKDMKAGVVQDTEDHITLSALQESATQLVPAGSVLLVVRSGILRHSIPVAVSGREVAINQDMKGLVPKEFVSARYLKLLIDGNQASLLMAWRKEGATVESIEIDLLMTSRIPIPSFEEQEVIGDLLDRDTEKIDALVEKIRDATDRLKEYRTALISAAVTGKIDVREEVP
jgi:type I restriction enzyme, S subunit